MAYRQGSGSVARDHAWLQAMDEATGLGAGVVVEAARLLVRLVVRSTRLSLDVLDGLQARSGRSWCALWVGMSAVCTS